MSVREKLELSKYLTIIDTLKNLNTPCTCSELTKIIGFGASNYLDRMYALGANSSIKVVTRVKVNNSWKYSYKASPDFSEEKLRNWIDKINSNPKRKYAQKQKLIKTEIPPTPLDSVASEAVDALTNLILENQQLKEKIERIERCLQ